ncbi:MAG: hypothetical protein JF887_10785 [Candidatus Dormibacteraeota bacterium]|uniref:Uncharacterized protein n=1 Tax=Candidatus Amunia macphersoniae TaxID=3127014 RepID=A0A934KI60_9BACT|nr:hypothetical protein [Candidatus Dormibacteraeota bacterium]
MAVYVIVIAAVVLLLIAAYRSLGGSSGRPVEARTLLGSLHAQLQESVDHLSSWLDSPDALAAEAARTGRRGAAGVQQTLDGIPNPVTLDDADAAARALLAAAAEDSAWAWRLVQADADSPGLTAAVIALRDHAADCCAAAAGLLAADAPRGEPGDGV